MANNKLSIINLNKTFDSKQQQVVALNNVNLNIEEGDLFCILGPSGCGKSTLLRCIAGFEHASEGDIRIGDKPIEKPGPDRTMVFQGFDQLLPWKTVMENVVYPLKVNKVGSPQERLETARMVIEVVGLSDFEEYYPHQLSGGMKQRVAIARALALRPKVLLMDEPFASLDAQTRSALQIELINLWEQFKTTIVFITHNIQEAIILGNKIAVMSKRPGTIKKVVENNLPRPRVISSAGFSEMWSELHNLLDFNPMK